MKTVYPVTLPVDALDEARARSGEGLRHIPAWAKQLAAEPLWLGSDTDYLFQDLGLWTRQPVTALTGAQKIGGYWQPRGGEASGSQFYRAEDIAYAALLLYRLGVGFDIDTLLAPLIPGIRRKKIITDGELAILWAKAENAPRMVPVFSWKEGGRALSFIELDARQCHDGRWAIGFRDLDGIYKEIICHKITPRIQSVLLSYGCVASGIFSKSWRKEIIGQCPTAA